MNPQALLALARKGVGILGVVLGHGAGPEELPVVSTVIGALSNILKPGHTPTQAEADATDATLDKALAEFNKPLPPAQPGDPGYVKE